MRLPKNTQTVIRMEEDASAIVDAGKKCEMVRVVSVEQNMVTISMAKEKPHAARKAMKRRARRESALGVGGIKAVLVMQKSTSQRIG